MTMSGGSGGVAGAAGSPTTTPSAQAGATSAQAGATSAQAGSAGAACTAPFEVAPLASKAAQCPKDPTGNLKLPVGSVTFVDAPSAPSVQVELARDSASQERGLMYRTSMPESSGMLFSWSEERPRSFWMHNTCIPLDMLYITKEGLVAGILEQVPTLNDAPRGIKCPVAHVLELNAGWARAHGVQPGMKVRIDG
jgi:uncharacterized membrane protein (UPF0127 family)